MRVAEYHRYGGPEVLTLADRPDPTPKTGEVLVEVAAAGVNTGDWRLLRAAFPGAIMALAGRLMFGITKPRNKVLGAEFAGRVAAVGDRVTEFAVGDPVFGFSQQGAHAEKLVMRADGAILRRPDSLSETDAAALPFGALAALEFLETFAELKSGERVLVVGASGGVGAYAAQIAKALGAEVTGVASAARSDMIKTLGADHVFDYAGPAGSAVGGPYDVVFDTVGALSYADAAPILAKGGRFVPLNFGLKDLFQMRKAKRAGHRILLRVNGDSKDGLKRLVRLIEAGQLRPVIDTVFPFEEIRRAYEKVETRHRAGAIVLSINANGAATQAA